MGISLLNASQSLALKRKVESKTVKHFSCFDSTYRSGSPIKLDLVSHSSSYRTKEKSNIFNK